MVTGTFHYGINEEFRTGRANNVHQFPAQVPHTIEERKAGLIRAGWRGNLRIRVNEQGRKVLESEALYSHRWTEI